MSSDISQIPIGKFSIITRLSQKALRLYDKKELLVPEAKDEFTGYRYYAFRQLETGFKIKMLVTMGFGINEIAKILDAASIQDHTFLKEVFLKKKSEVQLEIQRLKKIEEIIIENKPMELLFMSSTEPLLKEVVKIRVIAKRLKGTYAKTTQILIKELMEQIYSSDNQKQMVKITGPIMFIAHDDEYKEADADIEVAIPISGRVTVNSNDIKLKYISGGTVVSTVYTGRYQDIGYSYSKAFEFAHKNGYAIVGPPREIYLNDPNQVPQEQLMTEIQIPLTLENMIDRDNRGS